MARFRRRGISLIEIMLATLIMAFAMFPIAGMMGYGIKGNQKDFRGIQAIQLAEAKLNKIMVLDFAQLPNGSEITTDITSGAQILVPLGSETIGQDVFGAVLTSELINSAFDYYYVDLNNTNPSPYVATEPASWFFRAADTPLSLTGTDRRLRRLRLRVEWLEPWGVVRNVELTTYKADLRD
ncbi:hypothetical protein KBA41_01040 [Candidatus Ozemobacteraceae bacterium]|nr:hypothetical protein [Candidatus Ozemobacteraceae bacterium]